MRTYEELTEMIKGIEHIKEVNYWAKGEHERFYVNVESQNRFGNESKIYIDMKTGELVANLKKGQSGVKSYKWSQDVAAQLAERLKG